MLKGKIFWLAAVTLTISLGLTGLTATSASATTAWYVCETGPPGSPPPPPPLFCIDATAHGDIVQVSDDHTRASVTFQYPLQMYGSTWWEINIGDNLCLNYSPLGPDIYGDVYADSCVQGDANELWDNHPGYQFVNLQEALTTGRDAWLFPDCSDTPDACDLGVDVTSTAPESWLELALN